MTDATSTVRHPLWQGVQPAAGLWFPADWLPADVREARMRAAWTAGCRAVRFADGDLLQFEAPRTLDCAHASGQVLCSVRGVLASAPLATGDIAAIPGAEIAVVSGARVRGLRFDEGAPIDLSVAIDVDDLALHDTYDCRPTPMKQHLPDLAGKDVRHLLGDAIPPPSVEREAFLRRLEGRPETRGLPRSTLPALIGFGRDLGGAAIGMLSRLLSPSHGTRAAQPGVRARQVQVSPSPWRERLARLAIASRVGRLIGYRQGAYLRRMMGMFERGDLHEALRNALPLDGARGSLGQAFSTPGRRSTLELSTRFGSAASVGIGDELQLTLRQLYRNAFEQLDRQGRIDEAVFVLAELLNARQEAIDYLVKHGRHAQAAELALSWDMPAGLIIRLLMLTGDAERAVLVARRDDAFADAIQQLQASHPAIADALRLEWGQALVDRGDWLGAVDAVWPLPHAHARATTWLVAAEQAGITLSARALVQRARLLPDSLADHAARIEALADPRAHDDARTVIAEALIAHKGHARGLQALATHLLPAVVADRAAGRNSFAGKDLDRLMKLSGDAFLAADLPGSKLPPASDTNDGLWHRASAIVAEAPAAGLHPILDAVVLPDHTWLLAIGESGAVVVDARGRVRQRYAVPAFRLVAAASGHVALAVAPREHVSRVARLDLVRHAITDLGTVAARGAAPQFDGIGWTMVVDERILVVDMTTAARTVLWHVGNLPGKIVRMGFFQQHEVYIVETKSGLQEWRYHLPQRRLLGRGDLAFDTHLQLLPHPLDGALQPRLDVDEDGRISVRWRTARGDAACRLDCPAVDPATFDDEDGSGLPHHTFVALWSGLVVGVHARDVSTYCVVRLADAVQVATVPWPPGASPRIREHAGHLLFHDSMGRLLDIDIATSTLRHLSLLRT